MKKNALSLLIAVIAFGFGVNASLADEAAEMTRKLQDPLANIKALITGNEINLDTGSNEDELSYVF